MDNEMSVLLARATAQLATAADKMQFVMTHPSTRTRMSGEVRLGYWAHAECIALFKGKGKAVREG